MTGVHPLNRVEPAWVRQARTHAGMAVVTPRVHTATWSTTIDLPGTVVAVGVEDPASALGTRGVLAWGDPQVAPAGVTNVIGVARTIGIGPRRGQCLLMRGDLSVEVARGGCLMEALSRLCCQPRRATIGLSLQSLEG
jgi:hypothetical protein